MNSGNPNPNIAADVPLMQVKGLIKEFKAGEQTIRVLHDIDLTINQGEMVAIIGQSGSGKSTLMNILGCLDRSSQCWRIQNIWQTR